MPPALPKALRVCLRASPRTVLLFLLLRPHRPHMLSAPPPLPCFSPLALASRRNSDSLNLECISNPHLGCSEQTYVRLKQRNPCQTLIASRSRCAWCIRFRNSLLVKLERSWPLSIDLSLPNHLSVIAFPDSGGSKPPRKPSFREALRSGNLALYQNARLRL